MQRVYACLLGNWVNLDIDPNCKMDNSLSHPSDWVKEELQNLLKYDYINIEYLGKNYRIHPSFIQVVTSQD